MEPYASINAELTAILAELIATGWNPPFTFTVADGNGSFIGGTFGRDESGEAEPVVAAEHIVPRGFQLPVALTFVGRDGAVRVWQIREGARPVEVTH